MKFRCMRIDLKMSFFHGLSLCSLQQKKIMKSRFVLCFIFIAAYSILEADGLEEPHSRVYTGQGPLFVSLGADCLAAGMIQHFDKRQAAFPFDWILTLDEAAFLQVLNNNFQDFTTKEYLVRHPINGYRLVHSRYHIEFSHDWNDNYWQNTTKYHEEIEKLQVKYQRRIARFQQLENYKGTVVFIRTIGSSYKHIIMNPETYWFDHISTKNGKEFSLKLYDTLRNLFPHLDFKLIVVKKTERQNGIEIFDNITLCYLSNIEDHRNWELLFDCKY